MELSKLQPTGGNEWLYFIYNCNKAYENFSSINKLHYGLSLQSLIENNNFHNFCRYVLLIIIFFQFTLVHFFFTLILFSNVLVVNSPISIIIANGFEQFSLNLNSPQGKLSPQKTPPNENTHREGTNFHLGQFSVERVFLGRVPLHPKKNEVQFMIAY